MISRVREKEEVVRPFILQHVERHPGDIAALAAGHFEITRQAVDKRLTRQREKGAVTKEALGRALRYRPAPLAQQVFDELAESESDTINTTIVSVKLAENDCDDLIARSQAKRLLAGVGTHKQVVFDFKDVGSIGQAFADQIFRVFATAHPEIELVPLNAKADVARMISRALAAKGDDP